jgi:GNAT superfamily N-acetyltransferase
MLIRKAEFADIPAVRELVSTLSHYFQTEPADTLPPWFATTLSDAAFAQRFADSDYFNYVASMDGQLAGYIALKRGFHLHHLFVAPAFHRQGIAKSLWQHCLQQLPIAHCTVRSSLYAVPVYRQLGFQIAGAPGARDGIQFQPMTFSTH